MSNLVLTHAIRPNARIASDGPIELRKEFNAETQGRRDAKVRTRRDEFPCVSAPLRLCVKTLLSAARLRLQHPSTSACIDAFDTASSWVRSTRNLKPSADARIAPLFGAGLPTPPKPTTEGLLFRLFPLRPGSRTCYEHQAPNCRRLSSHRSVKATFGKTTVRRGSPVR